jgi:hypothetical protein
MEFQMNSRMNPVAAWWRQPADVDANIVTTDKLYWSADGRHTMTSGASGHCTWMMLAGSRRQNV